MKGPSAPHPSQARGGTLQRGRMHTRWSCGDLAERSSRPCGKARSVLGMDIETAYALLAELELHDVEDLGDDYFEAELADLLPPA